MLHGGSWDIELWEIRMFPDMLGVYRIKNVLAVVKTSDASTCFLSFVGSIDQQITG